jgi:hypothetical protein
MGNFSATGKLPFRSKGHYWAQVFLWKPCEEKMAGICVSLISADDAPMREMTRHVLLN